jgi:uncharacterized membrane protein YkvA (DUF1232 family)
MHASQRFSDTFPEGLAGLMSRADTRRRNAGGYQLLPERLPLLNDALHRISPDSPEVDLDQMATAARRVLERYPMGMRPAFVDSRMEAMARLQQLAADHGWHADEHVRECVAVLRGYLDNPDDLLPDHLPSIGLLDDALLVDLALQTLRDELADYEEFCQFRTVAADFAGVDVADTGLTRGQWQQALQQAKGIHHNWQDGGRFAPPGAHFDQQRPRNGGRFSPDPRASLFHIP